MNRSLRKDTFREIRHSMGRFLSILVIIALGVGFFVGIKATSPSMMRTTNQYFQDQRLMDLKLLSSFGFDDADLKAILGMGNVSGIMPSYSADVILEQDNTNFTVKVFALPPETSPYEKLNQPVLVEGRMPQAANECVVEQAPSLNKDQIQIGETVQFASEVDGNSLSDFLKQDSYTVVGIVNSPLYIAYDRGKSTVGDGTISYFLMLPEENFAYEKYTEVYVETNLRERGIPAYDDIYEKTIANLSEQMEELGVERTQVFENTALKDAREQLAQAEQDYETGQKKAEEKLATAKQQLEDARQQVAKGESELADGQKQYDAGSNQAQTEFSKAESQLANGKQQVENGKPEIEQAGQKLAEAETQYQEGLATYTKEITAAQAQLDAAWAAYYAGVAQLESKEKELETMREAVQQAQENYDEIEASVNQTTPEQQLSDAKQMARMMKLAIAAMKVNDTDADAIAQMQASLDDLNRRIQRAEQAQQQGKPLPPIWNSQTLQDAKQQLAIAEQQLTAAQTEIDQKKQELASAKTELDRQQASFDQKKAEGQAKLDHANAQIQEGKQALTTAKEKLQQGELQYWQGYAELANQKANYAIQSNQAYIQLSEGTKKLEEAKKQLEEGQKEYDQAVKDTDQQLNDAEEQMNAARKKLNALSDLKWYVFDRADNPGYSSFEEDALRIDAVAAIFPVFFLAVVLLVCLTTMTRMVEEQRIQIGTLKALGYSSPTIAGKYFLYSSSAGILGSLAGLLIGIPLFPIIIFTAYKAMYPSLPSLLYSIPWGYAIGGFLAAMLCTSTVSILACYRSLRPQPAILMRPKVPKMGKRILLERIGVLWKRLNFTSKVTARNLFRYKIRFCMTLFGVAGCTALIVAGLGLNDSVGVIAKKQFVDIFHYNNTIVLKQEESPSQLTGLKTTLREDENLKHNLFSAMHPIVAHTSDKKTTLEAYLMIPESTSKMKDFIELQDRISGKPLELTDEGVLLTEKLAKQLSLRVGDTVSFTLNNRQFTAPVGGITENYASHYIYMTPGLYQNVFKEEVNFNTIYAIMPDNLTEDSKNGIASKLLQRDDILAVSHNDAIVEQFKKTISSMNMVVLVLVATAGALVFVVLYNLTNINIEERVREIATLKVLGFYNKETAAYVFRENIILTLLGIGLGLFLGTIMTNFMIGVIELDIVMFGRGIKWTSYLLAAVLTAFFATCVSAVMYFKLKKINMIESLKSNE